MLIQHGEMLFHAGREKSIRFVVDGPGSIFFGSLNLKNLPDLVRLSSFLLSSTDVSRLGSSCSKSLRDRPIFRYP